MTFKGTVSFIALAFTLSLNAQAEDLCNGRQALILQTYQSLQTGWVGQNGHHRPLRDLIAAQNMVLVKFEGAFGFQFPKLAKAAEKVAANLNDLSLTSIYSDSKFALVGTTSSGNREDLANEAVLNSACKGQVKVADKSAVFEFTYGIFNPYQDVQDLSLRMGEISTQLNDLLKLAEQTVGPNLDSNQKDSIELLRSLHEDVRGNLNQMIEFAQTR